MPETRGWVWTGEVVYAFTLPKETPSNNVIKGMHFQTYRALRKHWQYMVLTALNFRRPQVPVERSALEIVRYCSGYLDWDNAGGGLKPLLDCLVAPSRRNPDGLGLIQDDSPKHMPYPPFMQQEKAKPGEGRTEIRIYQLIESAAK